MSFSKRSSQWANSALVVSVHPSDAAIIAAGTADGDATADGVESSVPAIDASAVTEAGNTVEPALSPSSGINSATAIPVVNAALAGVLFQEAMEKKAARMGGGNLVVPVQRVSGYLRAWTSFL